MFSNLYDITAIGAIVTIICILVFFLIAKKNEGKDWVHAAYFTFVLLAGAALYFAALYYNNDAKIVVSASFMILTSLSYSMLSFVGNFNIQSTFSELIAENNIFQIAIIIHFLAAVFLTFLAVVKIFGKKLRNEIRVSMISWINKYIVIGYDEKAKIFLKNLSKSQRRRTVVIIQPSQIDMKWDLIDRGYAVAAVKEEKEGDTDDNFQYTSFYKALKRAGAMRCFFKTRVISMFEQDDVNLLVAKIMTDYITEKICPVKENGRISLTEKQEKKTQKMKLEVRIMYSFLERAEHYTFIENTLGKLRFFNPYKINAHKIWQENPITKLIPFNWIDTNKAKLKYNTNNNKGEYKISTIFIGFGSVNKAILNTSIINNQLLNVDFNALIICNDAEKHKKMFRNSAIGLFDETDDNGNIIKRGAEIKQNCKYLESPNEKYNIVFKEADALTVELYDLVINEIEGTIIKSEKLVNLPCDYATVIIALGDDKLSIETALELRQKLYEADLLIGKDGEEYKRVRIFVKADKNSIFANDELLNSNADEIKCKIIPFGANEDILNNEYIINEKMDVLAKNIANRYEGDLGKRTAATEWNTCTQHKRESNRHAAMAIRVKLNLLGLDLTTENKTDLSNIYSAAYGTNAAFDLRAKRKKLEREITQARKDEKNGKSIPDKLLSLKNEDIEDVNYLAIRENNNFADTSRNNLAKLEHQRWNAFHLANDWTKLAIEKIGIGSPGRQDGIAKKHACITTFYGLIDLMLLQKEKEKEEIKKDNKKQYIEAESLLKADTIRHDFSTMDFLLDLSDENLQKMRDAEGEPDKNYTGILTGSGYFICELENYARQRS